MQAAGWHAITQCKCYLHVLQQARLHQFLTVCVTLECMQAAMRTTYAVVTRFMTNLGSVADAVSFPDFQKRLDAWLQVCIHEMVIEDTWGATLGELVGMGFCQVAPWEWPMIQCGACTQHVAIIVTIL